MNRRITLAVGGACVLIGLCLGLAISRSSFAQEGSQPEKERPIEIEGTVEPSPLAGTGRFQGVSNGGVLFLVDTVAGSVWMVADSAPGKLKKWRPAIGPIEP